MTALQQFPEAVARDYAYIPEYIGEFIEDTTLRETVSVEGALLAKANKDMLAFTQYTFPQYKADPFHQSVAGYLDKVVKEEIKNLMLFAPPQSGKSELVSTRLPSYWLAHNPELPVALVSYGASLAYRNSRYARSVFESPQYKEIFPHMMGDTSNWRMHDWHILDDKGYVLAAGVGGPLTGHGFGLGIIDDPIENWAAGQSETLRESVWQWWMGTFKTRMWEKGRIVFMMTRWHEDDLAGRILRREGRIEEGGKWTVISYPALADHKEGLDALGRKPGDALAPSRYSREYLEDFRDDVGPHVWSAEFQQKPTKPEGDLFKIGRIQLVNAVPAEVADVYLPDPTERFPEPFPVIRQVFKGTRAWDLAGSTKKVQKQDPDYTVGFLVVIHEGSVYLLDMVREQMSPDQAEQMVRITAGTDGKKVRVRIEREPGQAGIYQIDNYIKMLMGYDVDGMSATGDKMVRSSTLASQVNAGNVFMLRALWNKFALNELAGFPNAAHDDIVDAAAYAFNDQATGVMWVKMDFKSI
ncbi:MAG: phage terminase large subunit [Anaerolineales bacterium]